MKIRPTLIGMEVGQTQAFPILQLKSVRTQASEIGVMLERQYKTHISRGDRTIIVTRVM